MDGVGVGIGLGLVGGADGGGGGEGESLGRGHGGLADGAEGGDVGAGADAEVAEEGAGNGPDGHAAGGLAGAGALEGAADVVKAVLDAGGEVGVAGAGGGVGGDGATLPGGEVLVGDGEGDGRAGGLAGHHAREDAGAVGLDGHPAAGAGLELTAGEVGSEGSFVEREAGGHALDDDREAGAVGFPGREIREGHSCTSLKAERCNPRQEDCNAQGVPKEGQSLRRIDDNETVLEPIAEHD